MMNQDTDKTNIMDESIEGSGKPQYAYDIFEELVQDNQATSFPLERVEEAELIEAQNINSEAETALVVAKEARPAARFDPRVLWQALLHGIRWEQLKRQLTKEALLHHARRHWAKAAVVGAVCYLAPISIQTAPSQASASVLPVGSAASNNGVSPAAAMAAIPLTAPTRGAVVSPLEEQSFIERFLPVAKGEMEKYGIPASVILAIAIDKSYYGTTALAQSGNNYFQLSCNHNALAEGVVDRVLYEDACYVYYENAWTSFRAHSLYLQRAPFATLKNTADVRSWAAVLEQEGIMDAPTLLGLIQKHELHLHDVQ